MSSIEEFRLHELGDGILAVETGADALNFWLDGSMLYWDSKNHNGFGQAQVPAHEQWEIYGPLADYDPPDLATHWTIMRLVGTYPLEHGVVLEREGLRYE